MYALLMYQGATMNRTFTVWILDKFGPVPSGPWQEARYRRVIWWVRLARRSFYVEWSD